MILYLTSPEHTNLLDFLADQEDALPVKKMTGNFLLKQFVIYDMRNFSHCTELVLDRMAFGENDDGFIQAIAEFLTMYSARVTVICEGMKEQDSLLGMLLEAGVGNIITETSAEGMEEEIRESLSESGMMKYRPRGRLREAVAEEHYCFNADRVKIALVSSQSRIGTTTAALGFVAWLGSIGAKVCYIERNDSGMIPFLAEAYEMRAEAGGFQLENVWYGEEEPEMEVQFLVEDYGYFREPVEADVILLICGTKPYELTYTMQLLQQYETRSTYILCPFVDENLREAYVKAFQSDTHNVLFIEYQPDCMNGSSNMRIFRIIVDDYIIKQYSDN